jgi:DNA-cytosine methyltransferase
MKFFSIFTGAGGADCGALAAGLTPIGGIELDPYPAALYEANFGHPVRQENILDTPIAELPDFDFLWASPPCPSFSVAKIDGGETDADIAIAQKVAEIIRVKSPQKFALENVRGYIGSKSFGAILAALEGYNLHYAVYDAADFGVPQHRHRLILRASRDPLKDLMPTHSKDGGLWWLPWNGWYDAVVDLIPSCKQSKLTERQILALEKKGWYGEAQRAIAVSSEYLQANGKPGRSDAMPIGTVTTQSKPLAVMVGGSTNEHRGIAINGIDPANTITANAEKQVSRAVLVDGKGNSYGSSFTAIDSASPSYAITANMDRNISRAVLDSSDIRALDYRCLARLQSFPDWYQWGSSTGKNCRAIGNAIPPLFSQRVIESILGQ